MPFFLIIQIKVVTSHQIPEDMNINRTTRKLPKGVQDFEEMRKDGYLYVDKTDMVWQIANGDKFNFLSRPRRFGKSLLTSTLHYYFEGRKDLFEGLKIMEMELEWKKRQVFHFDFSGVDTKEDLESYLDFVLGEYEQKYGRDEIEQTFNIRLQKLVEKAYEQTHEQVVVLVDEYDTPLQHTLFNYTEHEKMRQVYRTLFPALKTASKYLRCLFLTGITKFTQLSLFSTLNNLTNLSFNTRYATVCGLTKDEIIHTFHLEVQEMADQEGLSFEQTIDKLRIMYDGYHFTDDFIDVYNPYSVINALADMNVSNYWIASGGSTMLNEMLQRADVNNNELDGCAMTKNMLEMSDVTIDNIPLFLYQTGYLTIKDYSKDVYTLGFPNKEVSAALYEVVLPSVVKKSIGDVDSSIGRMKLALSTNNINGLVENLKQLVSETPFSHQNGAKVYEERFRYILKLAFYLCGCRVEEEKQMAQGIIDLVAHYDNCILVMELKLENNGGLEAAKKQLEDRSYTSAFSAEGKDIYAIAIAFSTEKRGITGYDVQKII